jgi:hypothetical protein
MSIGSAFDAYVKSALHEACCGKGSDPQFEFEAIFTEQVEEQNRDWAFEAGKFAMQCYQTSGAYNDLLAELLKSEFAPQFEFKVEGEIKGVPLLGKPDCRFIHESGAHVVLDWKVNGFCSKYGASPYKGFAMIRDGWTEGKPSRGVGKPHKMYKPTTHNEVEIGSHYLEETCEDWADQLSIYGWMLGEKVGDENVIVCIDQLACKPNKDGSSPWPSVRVANHRCRISEPWQQSLVQRLTKCWAAIQSGYIFDNIMTREESDEHCEMLNMRAAAHKYADEGGVVAWVCEVARESVGFRKR